MVRTEKSSTRQVSRFYSRLVFLAFIIAVGVIILGAYTRLTNAGLSCPDWPRCYGYITPPSTSAEVQEANKAYPQVPVENAKAWNEMRHRYLAGIEGLLIATIVAASWHLRKKLPRAVFWLSQSLIAVMIGQVILGMLTVTALLKPAIVVGHLLFGFSIMSILWVMWLLLKHPHQSPHHPLRGWAILGLVILIAQIKLGGWVATHYAGLACIDFPYCNGQLLPTLHWDALNTDLITIHMLHRLGALVTFIYLSLLSAALIQQAYMRRFGVILLVLLALQVTLGILNIIWLRPISIALPHHAVAAFLLLTMLFIVVRLYRQGRKV